MLPRWYSTALGVMNNSAAISALVIPRSIRWATSVSRSVTPLVRLDQRPQRRDQPGIQVSGPLAAPAGPPCPAQRLRASLQLINAQGHRGLANPRSPGHQPDPAMPQRPGLSPEQQPPLPL